MFKFIFGNPENREWALSLYNAVNGSSYEDASAIQYTTIDNAVYMNMKNDVSFLLADMMNLYEQQSTFNPNMPMRFLIYAGMVYARYIELTDSYHQYSSRQQRAPAPRCICFYNGTENREEKTILKLSDSFEAEADIEVKVTMLNINGGCNDKLKEACKPLQEYTWFVDTVRRQQAESNNLEEAIDRALSSMPDNYLIRSFLLANRSEVKRMCITEYNEARTLMETREEGRLEGKAEGRLEGREEGWQEGREEGRAEGTIRTLMSLVKSELLPKEKAASVAGMTVEEFERKAAAAMAEPEEKYQN